MKLKLTDYWATPPEVFDPLNKEFEFTLDTCANQYNTKCQYYLCEDYENALEVPWSRDVPQICWLNPPYSNPYPWVQKASLEASRGNTVVAFLKYDSTTRYFKQFIFDYGKGLPYAGVEIRPWPSRVKFIPPQGMQDKDGNIVKSINPPWSNVVIIFRPT